MRKIKKARIYTVSIPYYHVFTVTATSKKEALQLAHESEDGNIENYDDSKAEIEEGPYVN
jgi:hypothetical protein